MLKHGMYDCIPKPKMVKLTYVTYIKYFRSPMLIGDLIYLTQVTQAKKWLNKNLNWHNLHNLTKISHVSYLAYIKVDKLQK